MALYSRDSILADVLMRHPGLIPVVNRLGVTLGVGDGAIAYICQQENINTDFFLSVINIYVDHTYFPLKDVGSFNLQNTIGFLQKTNLFFQYVQLPNIERHFDRFIQISGSDNNLTILKKFYSEISIKISECIEYETKILFPSLLEDSLDEGFPRYITLTAEIEATLNDLMFFFVANIRGNYDRNLCMAVISAVSALEQDYIQINRIRNRILIPLTDGIRSTFSI